MQKNKFKQYLKILLLTGVIMGILAGCLRRYGDSQFYFPDKSIYSSPEKIGLASEEVYFISTDGTRLHGMWVLPAGKSKATIVHTHGNAANLSNHFLLSAFLVKAGYRVFIFDYRGYGKSEGRITRKGTVEDTQSAIAFAYDHEGTERDNFFLLGYSLGASLTTVAASQHEAVNGVILEAPFTGYREIGKDVMKRIPFYRPFAGFLPTIAFSAGPDAIDYIDKIKAPILIIHGKSDQVIPHWMSEELFAKAKEPKQLLLFDNMDHLNGENSAGAKYTKAILDFLDSNLKDANPDDE